MKRKPLELPPEWPNPYRVLRAAGGPHPSGFPADTDWRFNADMPEVIRRQKVSFAKMRAAGLVQFNNGAAIVIE
jgi:hypothetical protein